MDTDQKQSADILLQAANEAEKALKNSKGGFYYHVTLSYRLYFIVYMT